MKRFIFLLALLAVLSVPAAASAIVGGKPDNPDSWPGLVMVRATKTASPYGYVASCSATLVAAHWVLTAAHCLDGEKYAFVAHGERNSNAGSWVKVAEIHRYAGWNRKRLAGDLALLKLSEDWSGVQPIFWAKSFRTESVARIFGWGTTGSNRQGRPMGAGVFRGAWTTIHSAARCRLHIRPSQGAHTLCAGDQRRNICQGDSGGPLLIKAGGRWRQIGVASFGNATRCGLSPAYYTDLYAYKKWFSSLLSR